MTPSSATLDLIIRLRDEASKDITSLSGLLGSLGGVAAMGAGVAGAAVLGIGAAAMSTAGEVRSAQKMIETQLGLTEEQAKATANTVRDVWGNNFGGSIEEVREDLTAVYNNMQRFGDVSQAQLKATTEDVIRLKDAFGLEASETANAASAIVDLGGTWDEAMNIIAAGNQRGLNTSGDLQETLSEYAPYFKQAGFSAAEMFSILETGAMAGVQGLDKAGDLVKEFGIRLTDGSKASREAFAALGVNYDQMAAQLNSGELSGAQVFDETIAKLKAMDDQVLANQLGVSLFGTQWEDMTADVIYGINAQATSMEDLAGATDSLDAQYDSLSQAAEGVRRRAMVALEPFAANMLNIAKSVMPQVNAMIDDFSDELAWAGQVGEDFATTFQQAFAGEWVDDAGLIMPIHRLAGALGMLAAGDYNGAIASFKNLFIQLGGVVKDAGPRIWAMLVDTMPLIGDALKEGLPILGGAIGELLMGIGNLLVTYGPEALPVIASGFQWLINEALSMLGSNIRVDLSWLTGIFDNLKPQLEVAWGVLEPVVSQAMLIFSNLKNSVQQNGGPFLDTVGKIGDMVAKVAPIIGGIFVAALGLFSSQLAGVAAAVGPVVEGILGVLGGLATAIGGLADIVSGVFAVVGGIITGDGAMVEAGLEQIKQGAINVWEGLKSATIAAFTGLVDGALAAAGGLVEGTINYFGSLYEQVTGEKLPSLVTDVQGFFRTMKEGGIKQIQQLWNDGVAEFDRAKTRMATAASAVGTVIYDNIMRPVNNVLTEVKRVLNNVIQTLNNGITSFNSITPGTAGDLPLIPQFANGTFSAPRGVAVVGENGPDLVYMRGGERVVSAGQSRAQMGAGRGAVRPVNVVLENVNIYNDADVDEMAYRIAKRIQSRRGGRG